MTRTKQRAHQTEHIREEWNDLSNNECNNPCGGKDNYPYNPGDHGIGVEVSRVLGDSEEDEARGYRL